MLFILTSRYFKKSHHPIAVQTEDIIYFNFNNNLYKYHVVLQSLQCFHPSIVVKVHSTTRLNNLSCQITDIKSANAPGKAP